MILDLIPVQHRVRLWWVVAFACIGWSLFQSVFTTSSPMSAYGNLGDESVMIQAGLRISHGQVPHRDFYSYPPGTAYYPLAGWFLIFGERYVVVQIFSFLTAFAICWSLWWIARRLTDWGAPLPAILFAVAVFPFWPFASYHWTYLLVALIATGLLIHSPTPRRWLLAGIAMGVSFLLLPNKALPLLAAQLLSFFAWQNVPNFRLLFRRYLIGLVSVGALTALAVTAVRGWHIVWQGVVMNNILYYPPMGNGVRDLTGQLMQLMVLLMICFALPLVFRLIPPRDRPVYYLVWISHLALIGSALYFFEQVHVLQIIGFGLVLFCWTFWLLGKHLWRTFDTKHWVSYGIAVAAWCFVCSVSIWEVGHLHNISKMYSVDAPKRYQYALETARGRIYNNPRWEVPIAAELPVMDRLLKTGLVGQRLFIFPFTPGYYYFYNYTNPTPYDILPSDYLPPGDLDRLKATLQREVDVVVFLPWSWNGLTLDSDIMRWVAREYPERLTTLDDRIMLFSAKPFSDQVQQLMR